MGAKVVICGVKSCSWVAPKLLLSCSWVGVMLRMVIFAVWGGVVVDNS